MMRSLYSAVSGIDVNQKAMDVIGNNIANVNTVGFKQGRAVFSDLLSQTLVGGKTPTDARGGVNPRQVGMGAYLSAVDNIFEAGTLQNTGRTTDLAIQGDGFFVLRGEDENSRFFSRAGDFNFDRFGNMVNPGGYKVQGWMGDPSTGEMNTDVDASDIQIGPEYKTLQAKPTDAVALAGILDSRANATILEFPSFKTHATDTDDVFSLFDANGAPMDLSQGEPIRVKAHATGITSMEEIFDSSDIGANIENGDTITMTVNNVPYTFTYTTTAIDIAGDADTTFSTMQGFLYEIQDALNNITGTAGNSATISNGKIQITEDPAAPVTFTINSFSGNSKVTTLMKELTGTYSAGTSKTSDEFYFMREINAGEKFDSLSELAGEIERAFNSSVVSSSFTVGFMDNDFGMSNGDRVSFSLDVGGTPQVITLDYTASANPTSGSGSFNTLQDMANELRTALTGLGINATISTSNGQLTIANATTSFDITSVTTSDSTGTTFNVSPYLQDVLAPLEGQTFTVGTSFSSLEVAGKGRMVYTNDSATDITGFAIEKAYSGSIFTDNMLQSSTLNANNTSTSFQFLTYADENAKLIDLFTDSGEKFNFIDGTQLEFDAKVGGQDVTNSNALAVDELTTLEDLMASIENYLGLGDDFNRMANVELKNGKLTVTGEKGKANSIDFLTVAAVPNSQYAIFNEYMEYNVVQTATGGQLVTNQTFYDRQGNPHIVTYDFQLHNEEDNEWRVIVRADDPDDDISINGATSNELIMKFNQDGSFNYMYDRFPEPDNIITNPTLRLTPGNGSGTIESIDLSLGTQGGFDGMVVSANTSSINLSDGNGYPLGSLERTLFNPAGEIVGFYTNGEVRAIGQIALALFTNPAGLLKVGDTMFAETGNSGNPAIGKAESGFRGSITSGSLENSNVDISREFVSLITTQRGFQANSRVVTTSDEMIQELLSMKR